VTALPDTFEQYALDPAEHADLLLAAQAIINDHVANFDFRPSLFGERGGPKAAPCASGSYDEPPFCCINECLYCDENKPTNQYKDRNTIRA
jgi:hypothetical protein